MSAKPVLTKQTIEKTMETHLPIGNVKRYEQSKIEMGVLNFCNAGYIVDKLSYGERAAPGMDVF